MENWLALKLWRKFNIASGFEGTAGYFLRTFLLHQSETPRTSQMRYSVIAGMIVNASINFVPRFISAGYDDNASTR